MEVEIIGLIIIVLLYLLEKKYYNIEKKGHTWALNILNETRLYAPPLCDEDGLFSLSKLEQERQRARKTPTHPHTYAQLASTEW